MLSGGEAERGGSGLGEEPREGTGTRGEIRLIGNKSDKKGYAPLYMFTVRVNLVVAVAVVVVVVVVVDDVVIRVVCFDTLRWPGGSARMMCQILCRSVHEMTDWTYSGCIRRFILETLETLRVGLSCDGCARLGVLLAVELTGSPVFR